MSLVSELRRRNVLRVATAYALVAWIIIEAGSVLLPTFGAPEGAFQTYVIVVLGGFVMSLILAWIFEMTPDGVKLDRDLDRSVEVSVRPQRKNAIIISLLVLALTVSISLNVTGVRDRPAPETQAATRASIAVLPFESRSNDPDNALFADGIHDDLLTRLANNRSLRVISRTSVLRYRDTVVDIRKIGRELGVDTILEGSVQRFGDDIRINMQLIDARTDEHLWAETYNEKLTMQDLFAIQTDIASKISMELRAALSSEDEDRMARLPTDNLIAYNRYNEARADMAQRQMPQARTARAKFEEAVAIDPDFAEAYAGLGTSILLLYINNKAISKDEAFSASEEAINRALELNPDLADAYAARGLLKMQVWGETRRMGTENIDAAEAFSRALELNPNHGSAYMWFGSLRELEGETDEAIALFQKSMEVDPLGRIPYVNLPALYAAKGMYDEALQHWIAATDIHPDWPTPYQYIAVHLTGLGRLDEALAWYKHARSMNDDAFEMGNLDVGIYVEFGDTSKALQSLSEVPPEHPMADFIAGFAPIIDGDPRKAQEIMLAAVESDPNLPFFVYGVVANVAMLNGDLETARKYALLFNPVLAGDADLVVDQFTVRSILQLAYIKIQDGERQEAYEMLNKALPVVQEQPRLGMRGHGILDVQIYALLGRTDDALAAFAEAVEEGFRATIIYNFLPLEMDPYLESIRGDDQFIALLQLIKDDIRRMRENTLGPEESGSWEPLRQIAIQSARTAVQAALSK